MSKEEVEIGFVHDTIKNYYLIEAIKSELKSGNSNILSSKLIVEDVELIKFIVNIVESDTIFKIALRGLIEQSKTDKSFEVVTSAANAITILVAAGISFSGEDLSNIAIKGANIRNGFFVKTDFTNADLTDVNMTNIYLNDAKLKQTIMGGVKLSIYPDLVGHSHYVNSVSFSSDGKYIVSGSSDKSVKLWL